MSRRLLISLLVAPALVVLVAWFAGGHYSPSSDGLTEEAVALSDMRRYCQVAGLDCVNLRVQERIAPNHGNDDGHWEFVVRLGESGPRYLVAVTPGIESQIAPLVSP